MKAKLNIYLGPEGSERLAKSGPTSYWHWHVIIRLIAVEQNGKFAEAEAASMSVPEGSKLIGVAEVELPSAQEAAVAAMDGIKGEISRRRAGLVKSETDLHRRVNELLSLTFDGGDQ